jgi:hypothetical protein
LEAYGCERFGMRALSASANRVSMAFCRSAPSGWNKKAHLHAMPLRPPEDSSRRSGHRLFFGLIICTHQTMRVEIRGQNRREVCYPDSFLAQAEGLVAGAARRGGAHPPYVPWGHRDGAPESIAAKTLSESRSPLTSRSRRCSNPRNRYGRGPSPHPARAPFQRQHESNLTEPAGGTPEPSRAASNWLTPPDWAAK